MAEGFAVFPREILGSIFALLPFYEVIRLRMVSKFFRDFITAKGNETFHKLALSISYNELTSGRFSDSFIGGYVESFGKGLRDLTLAGSVTSFNMPLALEIIGKHCPNIQHLKLEDCTYDIKTHMKVINLPISALTLIHVNDNVYTGFHGYGYGNERVKGKKFVPPAKGITQLRVDGPFPTILGDAHLIFPNITELNHSGNEFFSHLPEFFHICKKLRKIEIASSTLQSLIDQKHKSNPPPVTEKIPTEIEEFSLKRAKVLSASSALNHILSKYIFPSKKFSMSPHMEESHMKVTPILEALPETLTEISLDFFTRISDADVGILMKKWGQKLTRLSLKGAEKISQNILKTFPENFPNLTFLDLSWNAELTPDTFLTLCNLPNLKIFHSRGCIKINSELNFLLAAVKKNHGTRIQMNFTAEEKFQKKILQHEEDCSQCGIVKCPDCGGEEKKCQLSVDTVHPICPNFEGPWCPLRCGKFMRKFEIHKHLNESCPLYQVFPWRNSMQRIQYHKFVEDYVLLKHDYVDYACPMRLHGCIKVFKTHKEYLNHKCEYRSVTCHACKETINYYSLQDHLKTCEGPQKLMALKVDPILLMEMYQKMHLAEKQWVDPFQERKQYGYYSY